MNKTQTWDFICESLRNKQGWEKLMETNPKTLHYGYTTEDNRYWICPDCYEDFKDMFQWILVEETD